MKKIIVPIDFSEYSEYALETAATLARKYNLEILALHMLELSDAVLSSADHSQETLFFLKLAKKRFKEFLNKDYLRDLRVIPIIKHFKVFKEVNDVAKEHDADLIIMGSHGASGLREMLVGSNTEKVVRFSEIPVLIVKQNPILTDFETAIFACDFSKDAIRPYLEATKLFKLLGIKMQMVYVNLPDNRFKNTKEMEERVAEFLKIAEGNLDKLNYVIYINDYSIEKGIVNFANISGTDLIALATHGRTGLAHFFEGSISEDIANHSVLPVMTFKI